MDTAQEKRSHGLKGYRRSDEQRARVSAGMKARKAWEREVIDLAGQLADLVDAGPKR